MIRRLSATTLWLPLQNRTAAWSTAAALLLVYAASMCRDMSFYDSPELALVAVQLGLSHPIGQPLHTLLGWPLAHLPGIAPLIGLNFLSALFGALTVVPVLSIGEGLIRNRSSSNTTPSPLGPNVFMFVTVGLCGLHTMLWEPCTRIEVYSLAAFFALWAAARIADALPQPAEHLRSFLVAGIALGLSASAHAYSAAFLVVAMVPRFAVLLFQRRLPLRCVLLLGLGGILGLLPYLYVFLVAHRDDVFVWGAPRDLNTILHYFSGADYQRNWTVESSSWIRRTLEWFPWALERTVLPMVLLGLTGHVLLAKNKGLGRSFPVINFTIILFLTTFHSVGHPDILDFWGYLAVPMWLCAAGTGALLFEVRMRTGRKMAVAALITLVCLVAFAPPSLFRRTRHLDRVTRLMAEGALAEAPPRTIIVVQSDHWVAPLLYLCLAEKRRPDVAIFAYGLSSSSWYWDQLLRRHSHLRSIPLRGPGGRAGRARRFLAANSDNPIQFEHANLAAGLGVAVCPGGWLLNSGKLCADEPVPASAPERVLANNLELLGRGSPGADGMIAAVSFHRGESLRKLGYFNAALAALLAGVPRELLPEGNAPKIDKVNNAPILRALAPPVWRKPAALGDPGRNLFMAGRLLGVAGDMKSATDYLAASALTGLPEAERELVRLDAWLRTPK